MTFGDIVCDMSQVLDDNVLVIKPTNSGEEWIINNLYIQFGKSVEIYKSDGTNNVLIMSTDMSVCGNFNFRCSNSEYITMKNVSGESIFLTYDGIVSISP